MPGTHSGDPGLDHISQAERFCTNIKSPSEESSSLKKKNHHMTVTTEGMCLGTLIWNQKLKNRSVHNWNSINNAAQG